MDNQPPFGRPPAPEHVPRYLTVGETTYALSVTRQGLQKAIEQGRAPGPAVIGRNVRGFDYDEIRRWQRDGTLPDREGPRRLWTEAEIITHYGIGRSAARWQREGSWPEPDAVIGWYQDRNRLYDPSRFDGLPGSPAHAEAS